MPCSDADAILVSCRALSPKRNSGYHSTETAWRSSEESNEQLGRLIDSVNEMRMVSDIVFNGFGSTCFRLGTNP
jgi:hypothetical protein